MYPLEVAPLSYALLFFTSAISLYALIVDEQFSEDYLFHIGPIIQGKQYYRMLTPAFLHGNMPHLLLNMWTLWNFGPFVEWQLGTINFAIIYFGTTLTASLLPLYRKRSEPQYRALGASGAISGVLLAACLIDPMMQLSILGILPLPAVAFAVIYIFGTVYVMKEGMMAGIGHDAHLGGAIGGIILTLILVPEVLTRWFS